MGFAEGSGRLGYKGKGLFMPMGMRVDEKVNRD